MATSEYAYTLNTSQAFIKRSFDFLVALVGVVALGWLILLAWVLASVDTGCNGFFTQLRVGKDGRVFRIVKVRTMRPIPGNHTTVTRTGDPRITRLGALFRKTKIDELPQLWNILIGNMSFVGPRPDVPGYADRLEGEERAVLSLRPGITGPATLKYRDEEDILAVLEDPEAYNREVIWPDKVRENLRYIGEWSFWGDIRYIWCTITGAALDTNERSVTGPRDVEAGTKRKS